MVAEANEARKYCKGAHRVGHSPQLQRASGRRAEGVLEAILQRDAIPGQHTV
eukprot:COSAG04_NODE_24560_length_320_cov_0.696833_1_plen_51_part_10